MRDGMNHRTGMVVAFCSPFLFFGFMFTMSGLKGETLGRVPLVAIGPAICLPGVAAIILASRTNGCTTFPKRWCNRPKWGRRRKPRAKMTTGVGEARDLGKADGERRNGSVAGAGVESPYATPTLLGESHLINRVDQDELLLYLQGCYPASGVVALREASNYCVYDRKTYTWDKEAYNNKMNQQDSTVVFYDDDSPYGSYFCYLNPRDFIWDVETLV